MPNILPQYNQLVRKAELDCAKLGHGVCALLLAGGAYASEYVSLARKCSPEELRHDLGVTAAEPIIGLNLARTFDSPVMVTPPDIDDIRAHLTWLAGINYVSSNQCLAFGGVGTGRAVLVGISLDNIIKTTTAVVGSGAQDYLANLPKAS